MAAVPDFGALANQQATASNAAAFNTNLANRPNQTNALGSITWGANPDGTWGQSTNLNGAAQGLFDQTLAGQSGMAGGISAGLDYGSAPAMPQVGGYNQQVIDTWNALAQPGLQKQSDAARARAAAMGITLGSNASNDVESNIGTAEATQRNQAILQGYTQGNTEFDQALRARQQGTTEAQNKYSALLQGSGALTAARQSLDPNSWATKVNPSANYTAPQLYGAALDTFSSNQANENAARAQSNADRSATTSAVNTGLNVAGQIGWGNIWGGAKDLWNSWGSAPNYSTDNSGFGSNLAENTGTWSTGSFY